MEFCCLTPMKLRGWCDNNRPPHRSHTPFLPGLSEPRYHCRFAAHTLRTRSRNGVGESRFPARGGLAKSEDILVMKTRSFSFSAVHAGLKDYSPEFGVFTHAWYRHGKSPPKAHASVRLDGPNGCFADQSTPATRLRPWEHKMKTFHHLSRTFVPNWPASYPHSSACKNTTT